MIETRVISLQSTISCIFFFHVFYSPLESVYSSTTPLENDIFQILYAKNVGFFLFCPKINGTKIL